MTMSAFIHDLIYLQKCMLHELIPIPKQVTPSKIIQMINSNEAITIRLLHPFDGTIIHEFHPSYTYYFYGNDELVDDDNRCTIDMQCDTLQTTMALTAGSMREPLDAVLSYDQSEINLHPFKYTTFMHADKVYTIYKFNTKDASQWYQRVKVMSLFYIEGASLFDDTDPKWNTYALYEHISCKDTRPPIDVLCGYCNAYAFLMFPDKTRMRLSQFVILPPYQGQSLGTEFYKRIMMDWQKNEDIKEVTVEDPNPRFDAMRLRADYQLFFSTRDVNATGTHGEVKITRTHLERLKQLHLFKNIGDTEAFRLQYKKWLLKVRMEEFSMDDIEERKKELQVAYEEDMRLFKRILGSC